MAKPAVRLQVVEIGVFLGLGLLAGRSAQVQLIQGRRWTEEARAQRTERIVLAARRGTLADRHGTPLALTQETYHVGVAPNELRDRVKDGALISRQLGLPARAWPQALRKRYAYFAGPFSTLEVQPLRSVRGVHLEPVRNRFYPAPEMAHATIGRVGDDGHGASGLEKTLDSLLAGRPGAAVVLKDRAGREYESPARVIAQPESGLDVVLTLDAELQEIAQRALDESLQRMDADGGDVVMLDPATGEVLALASRRRDGGGGGGTARPSAFTDTFEPGSIAKIFAAAALLSLGRVAPVDRVSGEGGTYRMKGRPTPVTDEEPLPSLTLADAIRVSSNIAMVKFVARLAPDEQYGGLRDFGFGAATGIEFPAEASGRLRPPSEWTRPSDASLAMGYELSVTPIQVAAAYGALANDGLLLAPALIREVRSPGGAVLYRHRVEPVRRVVRPEVAAALRGGARHRHRGGAQHVPRRREDRHGAARGERAVRPRTVHRVVRGALPRRPPPARAGREDRQAEQGQLLRGADGGARHALDARAGPGGAHRRARRGPPVYGRPACDGRAARGRRRCRALRRPLALPPGQRGARSGAPRARRHRHGDAGGRARAASPRVPGGAQGMGRRGAHLAGGGRQR